MQALSKALSVAVDDFASKLADSFDLDKEKILEVWNASADEVLQVKSAKAVKAPRGKAVQKKENSSDEADNSKEKKASVPTCSYKFVKGAKAGQNCTSKTVDDTPFCKKHMGSDSKESAPKKSASEIGGVKKPRQSKDDDEKPVIKALRNSKSERANTITKNKWGHYHHKETGLVCERDENNSQKVFAVGRCDDNGNIIPLSADDVEKAKQYGLAFKIPEQFSEDKNKVKSEKSGKKKVEKEEKEEDEDEDDDEELVKEILEEELEEEFEDDEEEDETVEDD